MGAALASGGAVAGLAAANPYVAAFGMAMDAAKAPPAGPSNAIGGTNATGDFNVATGRASLSSEKSSGNDMLIYAVVALAFISVLPALLKK